MCEVSRRSGPGNRSEHTPPRPLDTASGAVDYEMSAGRPREQGLQRALQIRIIPMNGAMAPPDNVPSIIDQESGRQHREPEYLVRKTLGIVQIRVRDPILPHESADRLSGCGVVKAHAEDPQPATGVTLVDLHQDGDLFAAWKTPGRPEIQERGPAAQVRKCDAPAVEIPGRVIGDRGVLGTPLARALAG